MLTKQMKSHSLCVHFQWPDKLSVCIWMCVRESDSIAQLLDFGYIRYFFLFSLDVFLFTFAWLIFFFSSSIFTSLFFHIQRIFEWFIAALPFPCSMPYNQLSGQQRPDHRINELGCGSCYNASSLMKWTHSRAKHLSFSFTCSTNFLTHTYTNEVWSIKPVRARQRQKREIGKTRASFENALTTIKLKRPIIQSNEFSAEYQRLKSI